MLEGMMKYRLHRKPGVEVIVSLPAQRSDERATLRIEGHRDLEVMVRFDVTTGWGLCGHLIGDETTPADLAYLMAGPVMRKYRPECLKGAELGHFRRTPLPMGAVD